MPPLPRVEHFLDLIRAIENAAEALGLPVALEGYEPPEDPRLRRIVIEPDAGVLRLPLPASTSFDEHAALLETADDQAADVGLRAGRLPTTGAPGPIRGAAAVRPGGTT